MTRGKNTTRHDTGGSRDRTNSKLREDGPDSGEQIRAAESGTAPTVSGAGASARYGITYVGFGAREDGTHPGHALRIETANGRVRTTVVPHALVMGTKAKLIDHLVKQGADVPKRDEEQKDLKAWLQDCKDRQATPVLLAQAGGHVGSAGFLLGGDLIAADQTSAAFLVGPLADEHFQFTTSGSLNDWKTHAAPLALRSDIIAGLLLAAIAAPIADLTHIPPGGFLVAGRRGGGKSVAFEFVSAFMGGGYVTFNMSAQASETVKLAYKDLLILVDEPDTADGAPADIAMLLKRMVHRFAESDSRHLNHRASQQTVKSKAPALFAMASEHKLATIMERGVIFLPAGVVSRLPDLPYAEGSDFIIDRLEEGETELSVLAKLAEAAKKYRGAPGRHFIQNLVAERARDEEGLKRRLEQYVQEFLEAAAHLVTSAIDARIYRRFAGFYAAGRLGKRYGTLPKEFRGLKALLIRLLERALRASYPGWEPLPLRVIAKHIRKQIKGDCLAVGQKKKVTPRELDNVIAVCRKDPDGDEVVMIKPSAFRKICGRRLDRCIAELRRAGVLKTGPRGTPIRQERVPGIKGDPQGFYCLYLDRLRAAAKK